MERRDTFDLASLPIDIFVPICRHLTDDDLIAIACLSKPHKLLFESSAFLSALYGLRIPARDIHPVPTAAGFGSILRCRGRATSPVYATGRYNGDVRKSAILFRASHAMQSVRINTRQGVRVEDAACDERGVGKGVRVQGNVVRYYAPNFRNAMQVRCVVAGCPPCGIRVTVRCQAVARTAVSSGSVFLSLYWLQTWGLEGGGGSKREFALFVPNCKVGEVELRAHGQNEPIGSLEFHVADMRSVRTDGCAEFQLRYMPASTAELRVFAIDVSAGRTKC